MIGTFGSGTMAVIVPEPKLFQKAIYWSNQVLYGHPNTPVDWLVYADNLSLPMQFGTRHVYLTN